MVIREILAFYLIFYKAGYPAVYIKPAMPCGAERSLQPFSKKTSKKTQSPSTIFYWLEIIWNVKKTIFGAVTKIEGKGSWLAL